MWNLVHSRNCLQIASTAGILRGGKVVRLVFPGQHVAGDKAMHRKTIACNLLIVVAFVAGGQVARVVQAALAHRYSFTTNANDSVGTAHGVVVDPGTPTAVFSGGRLDLSANIGQGSNSISQDAYVDLPNGLITDVVLAGVNGAFSVEFWAAASATRSWQRFVDFGTSDCGQGSSCGGGNSRYIYITPNSGHFGDGLATEAHQPLQEIPFEVGQSGPFANEVEAHIVGTYDQTDKSLGAAGTFKFYRDGVLIGASPIPPNLNLTTFTNDNNWLGRSQWNDPVFDGYFNELRLYDHALTGQQVARNAQLGPNRLDSPLVYEGFDYSPPGDDLLGANGGSAFGGPWSATSLTGNYDIAAGSLSYPGLAISGNHVTTTSRVSGIGSILRDLNASFGQPLTTQYVSFVVRPEGTLHEGQFNGLFGLRLETGSSGDLFVGKPGGGAIDQFVMENVGGTLQHATGTTIEVGKEYLLVLRADFTSSGNDVLTLYVNPTPGDAEPTNGTVKNDFNFGIFNEILLYGTGAYSIDEIRMGASYADVVPKRPFPAGDYNQNGTVDAADYTLWRDRFGTANMLDNDDTPGVGLDDYDRWKSHFGESAGSGSSATTITTVFEPSSMVLLLLAATSCSQGRQSFDRRRRMGGRMLAKACGDKVLA